MVRRFINTEYQLRRWHCISDDTISFVITRYFWKQIVFILIQISQKCVPRFLINNRSALFQLMVQRRTGDKPFSEPVMA